MRRYRYASHALVLLVAGAIAGYSTGSLNLPRPAAPAALDAMAANAHETLGNVALGRDSAIIKPLSIPTAPLPNRRVIRYTVADGDTLDSVAQALRVTVREITWSNPGLRQPLKAGETIYLPPVPGVVVVTRKGDTAASLAQEYGVDATILLGFNDIRSSDVRPGMTLIVPVDPTVGPNLASGVPADPIQPGAFVCPIQGAKIIQKFGPTSFTLEPPYGGYLHFHTGVDLLADYGTPIDAAAGGRVTATGYADYYGLRVEITDSYGLVEVYAHMAQVSVTDGQLVQQGQLVGFVGSTGLSIGAHLHLQLEVGGVPTDPLPLAGCS